MPVLLARWHFPKCGNAGTVQPSGMLVAVVVIQCYDVMGRI